MPSFNQVLQETQSDDLTVEHFRQALKSGVPAAEDFADSDIIAYIKAFARNHITERVPFARTLN